MLLLIFGLIFCKSAKAKNSILGIVLLLLLVCGSKLPSGYLIRRLEQAYPAYDGKEKADAIVVLGGGTVTKSAPRQIVEVNGAGDRTLYAIHLYREDAADRILLGGSYIPWRDGDVTSDNVISSPASEMAELLDMFGIPEEAILIQDHSLNTAEEAVMDAEILRELGLNKILLVTSAVHMRRAVPLFEKQGLEVIPAPTDYGFSDQEWENFLRFDPATAYTFFVPSVSNIDTLQGAIKEYLGYFVYKIRGWL